MNTIIFVVTHWWLWLLISIGLYGFGLFLTVIGANNIDEGGNAHNYTRIYINNSRLHVFYFEHCCFSYDVDQIHCQRMTEVVVQ
jgi:hypothetical protein